jgi:hypothetical protein
LTVSNLRIVGNQLCRGQDPISTTDDLTEAEDTLMNVIATEGRCVVVPAAEMRLQGVILGGILCVKIEDSSDPLLVFQVVDADNGGLLTWVAWDGADPPDDKPRWTRLSGAEWVKVGSRQLLARIFPDRDTAVRTAANGDGGVPIDLRLPS